MKTPEQWLEEFDWLGHGYNKQALLIPIIQAIQKDAVEHCAQLVHDISRGTKSEQRAIAIDEARDLLIAESKP